MSPPRNTFELLMCRATKAKLSCTLTSQSASSSTISAVVMFSLSIRDHRLACARQQPSCAGLNTLLDSGRALGCISLPFTCYLYRQICTRQSERRGRKIAYPRFQSKLNIRRVGDQVHRILPICPTVNERVVQLVPCASDSGTVITQNKEN